MSNESMVDRILMNIMEASEIASLMSEMSLAKVLPQAGPIHLTLTEIQFFGRQTMQLTDHCLKGLSTKGVVRAVSNEVVVI